MSRITVDPPAPDGDYAAIYVDGAFRYMAMFGQSATANREQGERLAQLLRAADDGLIPELSAIAGRADVPDDVREIARRLAAVATGRERPDG